jgi:hypothetical protein
VLKKITITLLLLLTFLAPPAAAFAAYTGPGDRTIPAESCQVVLYRCQYISSKNRYSWHQVRDWACSNESKPWNSYPELTNQECNSYYSGDEAWEMKPGDSVTYDPVSASHSFNCATPGNAAWCRGGLNLSLSATETIPGQTVQHFETASGILCDPADAASVTCSTPVTLEGAQSSSYWAVSSFGDTSLAQSYSWKLDSQSPNVDSSSPAASGANGWYTSDVSVALSGTDATSGIDAASYRYQVNGGAWQPGALLNLTSDGVYNINISASDLAGNAGTRAATIRLDKTPPTLSVSAPPGAWLNAASTVSANAADAMSGLAGVEYRVGNGAWQPGDQVNLNSEGIYNLEFRATDQAGLTASRTATLRVDLTPPTVIPDIPAADGLNGWYVSHPTIPLSALDSLSGIDPGSLQYRWNSDWAAGTGVTVSQDGYHIVEARASDLAGNIGNAAFDVRVDTTAPEIEIVVTADAPQQNGWHVGPATATALATDAMSGLAGVEYQVETTTAARPVRAGRFKLVAPSWINGSSLTLEDGIHDVTMRASDNAGNAKETASKQVRVDSQSPVSSFVPVSGPASETIVISGASIDATSGVALVEFSLDKGLTWQTIPHTGGDWAIPYDTTQRPDGQYTVMVRATDLAGHVELPVSLDVTVNNAPPKVSLSEWWWIWESGATAVDPGVIPLGSIRLQVACGAQPGVTLTYRDVRKLPPAFTWNRRCGDGALAAPGEYQVTLTACNIYDKCASAQGMIRIPEGQTPTPTLVPTSEPEPSPTPTNKLPISLPVDQKPAPPPAEIVEMIVEIVPEVVARLPLWLLPLAGLVGSLAALGGNYVRDPRPKAVRKLSELLARRKDE